MKMKKAKNKGTNKDEEGITVGRRYRSVDKILT